MLLHRLLGSLLVVATLGGCDPGETRLRIDLTGVTPSALDLTIGGDNLPQKSDHVLSPMLPGSVVIHGLPAEPATVCVQVDGKDFSGNLVEQAAARAVLKPHQLAVATAQLLTPSLATLCGLSCPSNAYFCDGFEDPDSLSHWNLSNPAYNGPAIDHQEFYKGTASLAAFWTGTETASSPLSHAYLEKQLQPTSAVAVRAYVRSITHLSKYSMVLGLWDVYAAGFALGADDQGNWVLTEDQAAAPDHASTISFTGDRWTCIELVIDGSGMVSFFVDGAAAITPFARHSAVAYSRLHVGIERTIEGDASVNVDDVAVGNERLGCE